MASTIPRSHLSFNFIHSMLFSFQDSRISDLSAQLWHAELERMVEGAGSNP